MIPFFRYIVLATGFTALVIYLSQLVVQQGQLLQFIAVALLIAVPTLLAMLYTNTVATIHKSTQIKPASHLMRFTTSRILSTIILTIWSVCLSFWTIIWLSDASQLVWKLLLASILVMYVTNWLIFLAARSQYAAYCATGHALRVSRLLTATLLTAAFLYITHNAQLEQPTEPLSSQIETISNVPTDIEKSYVIQLSVKSHKHIQAYEAHLTDQLRTMTSWYLLALVIATFVLFYNFSLLLSVFLIPWKEFRRVFAPIEASDLPDSVSLSTIIFSSTVATLIAILIFPSTASLEIYLREDDRGRQLLAAAEQHSVMFAEMIDDRLCRPGTIAKASHLRLIALKAKSNLTPQIQAQSRLAFDQMRTNVDLFLDSYYSLSAEYLRIIGTLTGHAEDVISSNLKDTLMSGDELVNLDVLIKTLSDLSPALTKEYQRRLSISLDSNCDIEPDENTEVIVQVTSSTESLYPLSSHPSIAGLDNRMKASGAAAVGGVIAAKIVSKTAAKGGIKLAAKGLTKLAVVKAGSSAAGAAAGAAIGSVFPVVGTAIGGAIGLGIGTVIGVSTDILLLNLEEQFGREKFKAQILQSIDEQEREFNALLLGSES